MMTYLYETLPGAEGAAPKLYEFKQGEEEAPLTSHPETGEPIRRVILGGWGLKKPGLKLNPSEGGCCGPSGCC